MLKKEELLNVVGGATASYINAISRISEAIINVGRIVGSAIRRLVTRNYC